MGAKLNLIGQTFGRLVVISESAKIKRKVAWACKCSCGNTIICRASDLRSGKTKSCGCLKRENRSQQTHGDSGSAEYRAWAAMKERCYKPNHISYKFYHDRGIVVCDRWMHSYENFLEDMGRRPNSKMSLDRRDNDGIYCPENCRWATVEQQRNNTRNCKILEYKGEKRNMKQWATLYGIKYNTLSDRITQSRWSIEKALLTPTKITNKKR